MITNLFSTFYSGRTLKVLEEKNVRVAEPKLFFSAPAPAPAPATALELPVFTEFMLERTFFMFLMKEN
jgi:hypothetical protein